MAERYGSGAATSLCNSPVRVDEEDEPYGDQRKVQVAIYSDVPHGLICWGELLPEIVVRQFPRHRDGGRGGARW